jgi:hypothetical protein
MRSPIQTINLYSTLPATRLQALQLIYRGGGRGFATVSLQYRGRGGSRGFATVSLECRGFCDSKFRIKTYKNTKI